MEYEKYKCWDCGNTVHLKVEPRQRVYCEECAVMIEKKRKEELMQYLTMKTKVMHERALRFMEKSQALYMHEYQDASEIVLEDALKDFDKYQSSHEMIVAMILLDFGIEFEVQKRIGTYTVDFYIPSMHAVLEVDGYMHEYRGVEDSKRDIAIRNILGAEWEVVRIPTNHIEENPEKIVDAIEKVCAYKKKLRRQNGGILPVGYSKQTNKHYRNVLEKK